ncbi:Calx-beta domain-containing protein [Synechococcus sp. Cu2B8-bc1011]|uniref:Calx-beta domain-containing protein n=1 Tax=Synechococcus sp. Cu2B8-bc1011 TaxID=3093725 RepID=UPI0039AF983B
MDLAVTWLDELLNLSLAARKTFKKRALQEQSSETQKSQWQSEGTNSQALEKTAENYEFTNKADRSTEIKYEKETSISAHTFLSNLNKQTAWTYNGKSKPSFDTSNFSAAITEASNSSKKESFQTPNNERPSGYSFTEESSCFCPSCSRLNLLSEGSDALKALAPQETPRYTTLSDNINFENTFFLHSNPLANHTIYLDFDGFSINSTPWENGGSMSLDPFYVDLDLPEVKAEIQHIWNRVSADFAPFNINVTTEEPDIEDLKNSGGSDQRWGIRVALTSNQNRDNIDFLGNPREITNAGGGGTAYFNSFNWADDDVALVFNQGEYAASETVSHEVGHALNLRHDGTNTRTDNPTYYEGHGTGQVSWASIMGASFIGDEENVTTWSKGEYNDANNLEDDLSIITSGNGFGYRTDDHANEFNLASSLNYSEINPLNPSETNILTHGIIETNDDIDYFTFQTSSGFINLDISNTTTAYISDGSGNYESQYLNSRGANLDISATLYDSSWGLVATSNPNNFLSAGFDNLALDGGTYFLTVEGVGTGDPFNANPTGYTSYASLGEYLINGSVVTTEANLRLTPIESTKTEGNEGITTFRFDIILSEARQNQVTVDWSVSGDNSTNAADFVNGLQFGTAVINAGETRAQIEVYVQGDREIEDDETFLVELSNALDSEGNSIDLSASSATATIKADDAEIRGRTWRDLNENGAVDENERGLEGIKIFIDTNLNNQLDPGELFTSTNEQGDYSFLVDPGSYNISTELDNNQTLTFPSGYSSEVEPDSFTQGTVLNSINELAVLSAIGSSISNQDVTALAQDYVSTGTLGLSSSWNGGLWNTGNAELRVDFALPTDEVRIDFISDDSSDFGHMRAYDSSSNLLEEYVTQDLGTGIVETMTISRTNPDIAYILASGKDGQFGYLDNLRFSSKSGDSQSIEVTVGAEISINNDFGIAIASPPPTLSISADASAQPEGAPGDTTTFLFTVTRTGDTSRSSSAEYTVTGSGSNPTDLQDFIGNSFPSGVVNFAAGEDTQIISIEVAGDSILEQDETFSVSLTSPTNASISPSNASAIATISNDDSPPPPTLSISADASAQPEGAPGDTTTFLFTVTRTGDTSRSSSAEYTVTGSGSNPTDLQDFIGNSFPSGVVNFAAGEDTQIISIEVAGDSILEQDETFSVSLTSPTNASISPSNASAIATISNDDSPPPPTLSISADASAQPEGAPGDTTTFLFTVTRTGDTSRSSSAEYTVTGSGSNPTDLQDFIGNSFPSGVVNFAAGEDTQIISIEVAGDSILEQDETFSVSLTSPTNASISPSNASAIATISNDDSPPPPTLSISADASAQPEGAPGDTTTFLFTVTRTGDTSRSSSAEYTVTGSGSNPTDLQDFIGNSFPSGVVNFAAGEDTQIISIEVAGDSILEQDETFSVSLTSPTNASISPSNASAIATISNDDSPPQTSILFEETFEDSATWGRNWGLDPLTGWQRSSRRATEGTSSGELNGNVNNGSMTSLAIDLSGNYSSATLNFDWRIQRNLDNNESVSVDISNDNGESWTQNERTLRGNIDTENLWTQESIDLTSFIGSSEVRIRFRGTMNGQNERVNVDAIRVTAENIINGAAPILSISADASAQPEGAPGDTTTFLFTVTRTGDTSRSSSAEYTVTGSGSNPTDLQDFIGNSFPSGVVNFAAGEDTQIIPIEVAGDSILEQDETFSVSLTSPTNASISPSNASAIATISNDDSPPQTSILFEETFEDSATWERNWGLDPLTGWERSSRRATEGTWSGEVNGNVNNGSMTSLAIDLSGDYSSATLNFDWRIQRSLDNNESVSVDISNDNGESWTQNERTLRGNIDTENLWTQESIDLTSFIGSSEVRIRFRGTMNRGNERANVDNINISATSGNINGQLRSENFEDSQNTIDDLLEVVKPLPDPLS